MAKVKAQELLLMPGEQELGRFSSGSGIEEGCQRSTAYTVVMTNARLIVHQRAYLFWCIPYDTEYSLMTKEVVDVIITNSSGGWIVGIISTCIGAVVLAAGGAANSVVWIVIGVFFLVVAFFAMLLFILKIVKRDMDVFIDVCKDKSVIASHANAFTRGQPRGKCCKVVLPAAEGYRLMHAILAHPETQLLEAPTHVQVNCAV